MIDRDLSAGPQSMRLDWMVARYGPMPEPMVRALGTVLAQALTALHALGQVHGAVAADHIEVTVGGPRLLEPGSAAQTVPASRLEAAVTEPVRPADDVYALAAALAFAATGSAAADLSTLSPGLGAALSPCLSGRAEERPAAADVARVLDSPMPDHWLPADPVAPVQFAPGIAARRGNRLPWTIAAVCWAAVLVVVAGTAAALTLRQGSASSDYPIDHVADVCALIDLPPLEELAGAATEKPSNDTTGGTPEHRFGLCSATLEHGTVMASVTIEASRVDIADYYRAGKSVTLGTTGAGVDSGTLSGLGEDAYFSVRKTGSGDFVTCEVGFIDANLTMSINFSILEDPGISRDDLAAVCEQQGRTALGRLQ
ncbi:hypothetical protein [Nocardia carnea]|uniref:hypothetical protein n=1 Tax=Nocardia carnea TaxID=37328 RepID=UPI0024541CF0|nr:hypothetical protein [Nocardia carnea]